MIESIYKGEEKNILKVLPELFPELSFSEICASIRRRDVKIDGVRIPSKETIKVKNGNLITIYPKTQKKISIIYEDDNILACYKPKGIASQGESSFEKLVSAEKGRDIKLMHRLDTNTDGILLFAKNSISEKVLFNAIKNGDITKKYTAEVYGHVNAKSEVLLKYYYKKDENAMRAFLSDFPKQGYIPVEISFHSISEKENGSKLEITLHKGKMHQIRAMLAHYGYFILGDGKYGNDRINKALGVKKHLLTATKLIFSFDKNSPLYYLNGKEISI